MRDLVMTIPDADVVLAFEPEELGGVLLGLILKREGDRQFHPNNYALEISEYSSGKPPYPEARQAQVEAAIIEAFAWLEGQALIVPMPGTNGANGWRRLSRRAKQIALPAAFADFRAASALPQSLLHPSIARVVWTSFVRGEFDTAVFQAMKQVEVAVREASGLPADLLGVKLMRRAFDLETGPLRDADSEAGERQARSDLFAGALGSYKNPQSHRHVALSDPAEAVEIIMMASHLLKIVDARRESLIS